MVTMASLVFENEHRSASSWHGVPSRQIAWTALSTDTSTRLRQLDELMTTAVDARPRLLLEI